MPPDKPKRVMGIQGLSKYVNVPKSTLYKLAREGKLPGQKVGKHWRFRQETINKWLDGEQVGSSDEDQGAKKHGTGRTERRE
ncbi:MAG: helix-turn-helix domain-containing protein [bacterium]